MRMDMYIPDPDQALEELYPLIFAVHDFLLESTDQVLPYFQLRGLAIDRTTSGDMFRFELLRRLKANCQIKDHNYQDLSVKKLSNNGIECRFAGWTIKIFSGTDLHPPGYSSARLSFFRQEQFLNLSMIPDLFPDEPTSLKPNIVLLYEFSDSYTKVDLKLALPMSVATRWSPVECYWKVDVPLGDNNQPSQPPGPTTFPETFDLIDDLDTDAAEIEEPDIQWRDPQGQEDVENGDINGTGTNPREPD